MSTPDVNHQSNDLTESQIVEKALALDEKKKALAEHRQRISQAPTLFSWECTPPRDRVMDSGIIGIPITFGIVFGLLSADIRWGLLIFALMAPTAAFLYFTGFHPKTYRYDLTKEGIRYTIEENVPDAVFTFVRTSAWIGAGICVLAVFVVGPIAFVGAGAAALGAFSFTGFKKKTAHRNEVVYQYLFIRRHLASMEISIISSDNSEFKKAKRKRYSTIYADEAMYQQFLTHAKPLFTVNSEDLVKGRRELDNFDDF